VKAKLSPSLAIASALLLAGCDSCQRQQALPVADAAPIATVVADAAPVNASPIPTASVARLVNPDGLPAYAGPTGSVEGTITVVGDPAPETPSDFGHCADAAMEYGHAFRDGTPSRPGGPRWLADAVVAVTGYTGFFVPETDEAKEIAIVGCGFDRRTVTMTFGQRLEVKNRTKDFWTPKLEPSQSGVMMMATPNGDPVKLYPKKPGHYRLIDHDRKYAVDDLYVFLHPLHTSSRIGGTYRIDRVPVGKVTVNTSHPRIAGSGTSKQVEIREGVVTQVDLELTYQAPDAGPAEDAGPPLRIH
jgi:hypothetical protein